MSYKGIILSGGLGTRLAPLTSSVSKQLLPVYDKPMIFYSLSVLMLSGIRDILLVSSPDHIDLYKNLLGTGERYGIKITYQIQKKPAGIAEAFILGESFIEDKNVALILGDNIFYGYQFSKKLREVIKNNDGATIFAAYTDTPHQFGVVEFNKKNEVISIEEKPKNPKSNYAITGLYFYNNDVIQRAKFLKPSPRNELEITDINKSYLKDKKLNLSVFGRGFTWLDAGNADDLLEAGNFVKTIENRQGLKIACLEEIAITNKWIDINALKVIASTHQKNKYGEYLVNLVQKYESN
jgi:glucose-1-phosphate thymidylyltransferase